MSEPSDFSSEFMQQINEEHGLCQQSLEKALEHACEAGRLLCQAKNPITERALRLDGIPTDVYMEAYRRAVEPTARWEYSAFAYLLIQLTSIQRSREARGRARG